MKKNLLRIGICALAMLSVLSLGACGSSNKGDSGKAPASSAAVDNKPGADGKYASVEGYVASEEIQNQIKEFNDTLAEDGMKIDIVAEGSKMVMLFDLSGVEGIDADTAEAAAQVMEDSMGSTLDEMAEELSGMISGGGASLEIRYVVDGETVYTVGH